ncbi:MAG: zinc-dependent peptidase [Planctomycetota bacterium]
MLVTESSDRANRTLAIGLAIVAFLVAGFLGLIAWPFFFVAVLVAIFVYFFIRRSTARRRRVLSQPFRPELEATLQRDVEFFRALDETGRERFRNLVKVFLDEVRITGVRTDVDAETEALVAASAVIPIFGFDDWEYSRLGEVLIYPGRFDDEFNTGEGVERRTLGMVGVGYLSGVMILSKPDLIAGFRNPQDKRNVGIHEFAHLVDRGDGAIDGLPPGVELSTAGPWIEWVGQELKSRPEGRHHIDDYAYTNEAEYFAVLSEYFFEAPDVLAKRSPKVYEMMQTMYRQNTRSFLSNVTARKKRVGRNAKCPCGSGRKFKKCCLRK